MILIASNNRPKKKMIFHKSRCFYINRISNNNYKIFDKYYVRNHKYHTCKYCDGFAGDMRIYKGYMEEKSKSGKIKFYPNYDKEILFVETSVGLWKLYRDPETCSYALYHHNYFKQGISVEDAMAGRHFHRQTDVKETENLEKIIDYVIAHDKAKEIIADDYRKLPKTSKQQKKYYRSAQKKDRKQKVKKVYQLFTMLESENGSLKALSIGQ